MTYGRRSRQRKGTEACATPRLCLIPHRSCRRQTKADHARSTARRCLMAYRRCRRQTKAADARATMRRCLASYEECRRQIKADDARAAGRLVLFFLLYLHGTMHSRGSCARSQTSKVTQRDYRDSCVNGVYIVHSISRHVRTRALAISPRNDN